MRAKDMTARQLDLLTDPRTFDYPFEDDVSWRDEAGRCECGEPLYGEVAEVVRDGEHVVVHVGCMLEDEEIA